MSPATVAAGTYPASVTVDPSGRFAYAANNGGTDVSQYAIGADGALMPMTPAAVSAGASPISVAIDSSDQFAYGAGAGTIIVLLYDLSSDGTILLPDSSRAVTAGQPPLSNIDPFLTQAATAIAGSPFPTGRSPVPVATTGIT